MRTQTYRATDTEFSVISPYFPELEPRLWEAINAWLRFHDIDPHDVPLVTTIVRNIAARRVEYYEFRRNEQGLKVIGPGEIVETRWVRSQGEAPPLPFPTVPPTRTPETT